MREPIPTWFFVLVVVRKGDRFLVVHECKYDQCWYLPAGRVEPGEAFTAAAEREALEETGIPVVLEGVLKIEHLALDGPAARIRVIFVARPADDRAPKSEPDDESLGASWVTLDELDGLPLRGDDVRDLFLLVAGGATVHPLSLLATEPAALP